MFDPAQLALVRPPRSHSSGLTHAIVRPWCIAAVKNGPFLGPPRGLVLDGRKHDGTLASVEIDRAIPVPALVLGRAIADRVSGGGEGCRSSRQTRTSPSAPRPVS